MNGQAPFSTPTRWGSRPAYSAAICLPISTMRPWIWSKESNTFITPPPREGAIIARQAPVPPRPIIGR